MFVNVDIGMPCFSKQFFIVISLYTNKFDVVANATVAFATKCIIVAFVTSSAQIS